MPNPKPTDTQPLGFLRYRKNGRLDEINSAVPKLFGYKSKKEFLSSKTPKEIFDLISEKVTYMDITADWSSFESIFSKKDGSKLYSEYFISLSDDSLKVHINDIGVQEGLERALRESEEKSKLMLDTLVDGVITMGTNFLIESVNPAVEKIFGYKDKELIGKNIKILMPEPDKSLHNKYVDSYQKSGKAKIIGIGREVKGRKKNGKIFPIYLGVSELTLKDRKLYIGLIRDISVQKKAENDLLLAHVELENKVTERTSELLDTNEKLSNEISFRKATEKILERQASFVRQNPGPVFQTDYRGMITFANPVSEKLYGKNLINKSIIDIMKGITKSQLKKLKGERAVLFEEDIGDKTFLLTIIKDTKAKNIYVYGADITLHRQSEELLRISEERFRQFFYNQPEYCYVVSPEGIILDANPSAFKILGYKRGELVGKSVLKIYPPESRERVKNNLKEWLSTGILKEVEMEIVTKHGERRNVYLTASAIYDKNGKLLHSISVQLDITDKIRDQKEKERLSRNLGYRVKELSCLQAVGEIIENETSLSRLLSKVSK
ncbi:MAG: PAS domain S-box protein, partial [Candidatus Marinimicrobia bacterium]|nr:PAS domain S-box protein [Candidatus Neomarinimicrobiota bacterium]